MDNIEFSETTNSNLEFSKPTFKENHIFEPSFYNNVSCPSISFCGVYAELIDSWKVLDDAGVDDLIRKNIDELDLVNTHYDDILNYPGGYNAWKLANTVGSRFFKSVDEFALTFDKAGNVSQSIRQQAYDLYNAKNWNALEDLFSQNSLNGGWPPGNGGFNIVDDVSITAGQKFDRYGGSFGEANGNPVLGGSFTSPVNNNTPYGFGQRALNGAENTYDFHYEIEVLQDLPFKAQNADVIPWFGQAGGGKQSMWKIPIDDATGYPKTWNKLAEEGYIKITIKNSPSGNFSNFTGTVIQN